MAGQCACSFNLSICCNCCISGRIFGDGRTLRLFPRAVQFRKLTDAQICEYLDSLLEREREARSTAPAPSKEEIVNEFLDTLRIRTTSGLRVSDATIRKIRSIAVDRGFIKSAEVSDG